MWCVCVKCSVRLLNKKFVSASNSRRRVGKVTTEKEDIKRLLVLSSLRSSFHTHDMMEVEEGGDERGRGGGEEVAYGWKQIVRGD